jgi:hypothetical protein
MSSWVVIAKGKCTQMPQVPICMGKTGASPSPRALLVVEQILTDYPQKLLSLGEIRKKYRCFQAIVTREHSIMDKLETQKVEAAKNGNFSEVTRLKRQIEMSYTNFLNYNHYIDMLFSHGPPDPNLTGRTGSLESAFRYIGTLSFSEAQKILHQLLTSVYFREVAIFNLALMALRGQFDDKDARGTCIEKVDSDLAAAWASKLTDHRLLKMYDEAKVMHFYDLWRRKFNIWDVLKE